MDSHITRLLSIIGNYFPEPLDSGNAFYYASLLGELLMLGKALTDSIEKDVGKQLNEYVNQGEKRFQEETYVKALEAGIRQLLDAHRKAWADIDFYIEADAFYELDMVLSGRDGLEYVSEAVKHYGNTGRLGEVIESYKELDEILRSRIEEILVTFENDFRAQPSTRMYPDSFWWRPLWARFNLRSNS